MLRILFAVFTFLSLTSTAAHAEGQANAVSFELLGRGLLWSVNYDRMLTDEIAVGAGFSSWSVGATYSDGTTYAAASVVIVPIYMNYYLYKNNGNRWFVTAGLDIISAKFKNDNFKFSDSGVGAALGGGYEYRGDSGFLFRGALYVIAGGGGAQIWPGLSLGYTF